MFRFLSRNFPHLKSNVRTTQAHNLLPWFQLSPFSTKPSGTSKSNVSEAERRAFTADYLVQKCGFSREKAVSALRSVAFETSEQPDSVILFLKNLKLTETQISKLLKFRPSILLCDPEKNLLPKISYFRSLGFSPADISDIVTADPAILKRNLEEKLVPTVDYFKSVINSDKNLVHCFKRHPSILRVELQTSVMPNISLFRNLGVPEANIESLLIYHPRIFVTNHARLISSVEKVKELGFDPSRMTFMLAVYTLRAVTGAAWNRKMEIYKSWGLSETEILEAFGKQPWFMVASEDKIMGVMDFLINQMGFESSLIARRPGIIVLSLQKRIKPRCAIYRALLAKGLVGKKLSLSNMLCIPETKFLKKFVESYKEEASELLEIYNETLSLSK